jgi:aspartate racemase
MTPTVIIGGGVGPMAGVALHRSIIEQTATDGRDQSHLPVVHLSFSHLVPDRTEFLLGREARHPGEAMAAVVARAGNALPPDAGPVVLGVPCNTFHAPSILSPFLAALRRLEVAITFVNMVDRTIGELRGDVGATGGGEPPTGRGRPIGVMSTTGTRRTGLWQLALEEAGFAVLQIPEEQQDDLHASIYHLDWGLKAKSPPDPRAVGKVAAFANGLAEAGAETIVLACTELPLALPVLPPLSRPVTFVDPVAALARGLILAAGSALR